jgi:hypothetical protein
MVRVLTYGEEDDAKPKPTNYIPKPLCYYLNLCSPMGRRMTLNLNLPTTFLNPYATN